MNVVARAETEAHRGFSQVRATQTYVRSVEETAREKPIRREDRLQQQAFMIIQV